MTDNSYGVSVFFSMSSIRRTFIMEGTCEYGYKYLFLNFMCYKQIALIKY